MKKIDSIARLHAAETEARALVAAAHESVQATHAKTAARIAQLQQAQADELAALREDMDAEKRRNTAALAAETEAAVRAVREDVAAKLDTHHDAAVRAVVAALTTA